MTSNLLHFAPFFLDLLETFARHIHLVIHYLDSSIPVVMLLPLLILTQKQPLPSIATARSTCLAYFGKELMLFGGGGLVRVEVFVSRAFNADI